MVTTGFSFEGYKITKYLGLVRGITVRSRSIVGTLGAALQTLGGGNISPKASGANAVIGMNYDATEVMSGVTEVLAYGTAVVIEKAS